jgi:superfamily II DNA or RNA helicase
MMQYNPFEGTKAQARDYQIRICSKVISMLDGSWVGRDGIKQDPAKSILIDAPTGSGKTVMALAIAQYGAIQGKRIGWVAMRRNLLRQAIEMRDLFAFQIPDMKLISMFDKNPPRDVDWLCIDESHHDSTDSMARIHEAIKPEKVIGLSATPFRSDRMKLAFEKTVKDVGINALIQEGWLSKYDHYTIPEYTPLTVTELFQKFPDKWGKSIVFFRTMDECVLTNALMNRAGIKSDIVWGGSDREAQIDAFKAGDLNVLVSMSILAEGFDMEDLQTVFIRPSSKLPTIQMCGRVLRLHPGLEAKQIIQCKDTKYPFIRTAVPRMSYVQIGDQFRSLSTNADIESTANWYAQEILHAHVVIPDFIIKHKKKSQKIRHSRRQRRRLTRRHA